MGIFEANLPARYVIIQEYRNVRKERKDRVCHLRGRAVSAASCEVQECPDCCIERTCGDLMRVYLPTGCGLSL